MNIVRRAAGASATGTTSVTLHSPADTVNGDVLLAFVVDHATSGSSAAPTGWTNQGGAAVAAGRFQVFSAVVGLNGLTGASWSFAGLTTPAMGVIVGYINVDNTTPLDVAVSAQQNASGTTGTASITPTSANAMIVAGFASMSNGSTWSAEATATSPGSLSEISDNANSTFCSLATADGLETTATATGASSATMGTATDNAGILVALRPALGITAFFRQAAHAQALNESTTVNFAADVPAGDLLFCFVKSAFGVPQDPGFPTVTISTPGCSWTLIGSAEATASPYIPYLGLTSASFRIAVYAVFNSPALAASVPTTVTAAGGPGSTTRFVLADFQTTQVVNGPFTSTSVSQDGLVSNPPHQGDFFWTTTDPTYRVTAGTISASPENLVIVVANDINTLPSTPNAGPGFTLGTYGPGTPFGKYATWQFMPSSPGGAVNTQFSPGPEANVFAALAFTFVAAADVGGGGGGGTGCGECTGPRLLELIPGFSDLPDSVLEADDPAFALHVGEIAFNATFGMVRCESFPCVLKHGDTVPLPQSCWDGYKYSRSELTYLWAVQSSLDPSTNWISGPDSLWFMNWNVNQITGEVFSEEWYERSSAADSRLAAKSNDGQLLVFTIGQRQKDTMIMAEAATYNDIDEALFATDKPVTQELLQMLNQNAKFSCVNSEVFYLGEYTNGQTVTLPVSPVDGYTYSAGECKFQHSWRWTASGASYVQPPGSDEQAAPFSASINSSGVVSITVKFATDGGESNVTETNYGRIAAFAFCTRSDTPSSGPLADDFTELALDFFAPGATVRASEVLTIKRNIDEAILSPEFFGPTDYADADVIPLPTSPVDGYAYSRSEVQYLWSWSDTNNSAPGNPHIRLPLFLGSVDPTSGLVKLRVWRLPPGGPFVDDNNTLARVTVLVMATRQAIHPAVILGLTNANSPADAGTFATDRGSLVNGT